MLEFFRGGKRKAGCVTLVLACVFAVGWLRSHAFVDSVSIPIGRTHSQQLISVDSSLGWQITPDIDPKTVRKLSVDSQSFEPGPIDPTVKWHWQFVGFGSGESGSSAFWVAIPYWSIVLPLTGLSAWLLLSKPRAKINPPIIEDRKP